MSGTIMAPTAAAGNSTPAMGTPEARLFLEPQNTMAISSSREKPRARADQVVALMTMVRITAQTASTMAMSCTDTLRQMPSTTAALKAV